MTPDYVIKKSHFHEIMSHWGKHQVEIGGLGRLRVQFGLLNVLKCIDTEMTCYE